MNKSTISKQRSYLTDLLLNSCCQEPQALYALVDVTHVAASAYQHGGAD
ncbi:hypothetical protein [Prevotella sp.]|nr:hypothetical protein [Prevotella sp.]